MATYLGTHGGRIQNYTTDPDNPKTGEVWYNDTANTFKFQFVSAAGVWTTQTSMNSARKSLEGAGTSNTAALAFGGSPNVALTELYNGTSWTEKSDLTLGRSSMGSAGSSTAAIAFGGSPDTTDSETWNGSSWTEITAMNTARGAMGPSMAGTVTAVLGAGGANGGVRNLTEQWNGSSWTEVGDLNTTRYSMAGAGTVTSALVSGGYNTGPMDEY